MYPKTALYWDGVTTPDDLMLDGLYNAQAFKSYNGQIVGSGQTQTGNLHALLWTDPTHLVDLHPAGYSQSGALGLTATQEVGYGTLTTTGSSHALLWNGSSVATDLNPAFATSSTALAISGGEIVGFSNVSGKSHATLWDSSLHATDIQPSFFDRSEALGVGDHQQVGDGWNTANSSAKHALLWNGTSDAIDLNPAGFTFSIALGAGDGRQVGFATSAAIGNQSHAMLWDDSAESYVDLQTFLPASYVLSEATSISDNVVYGFGYSDGAYHALAWALPEPSGLAALAVAAAILQRRRRA